MNESIKKFLNNEVYILAYRSNYDSAREVNQNLIDYIKDLQQERNKYKSIIDEAIELRKEFLDVNENQLIVFENNELIVFMNKLHDILNKVGDSNERTN